MRGGRRSLKSANLLAPAALRDDEFKKNYEHKKEFKRHEV